MVAGRKMLPVVHITGMGLVTALADTLEQFTDALRHGRSAIRPLNSVDMPISCAALIENFDSSSRPPLFHRLPDEFINRATGLSRRSTLTVQTAIDSALQAWQQAGLGCLDVVERQRTGLVVAGQNLSSRYNYDHHQRYQSDLEYLPPSYGLHFLDTDLVGTISELLGVEGPGLMVGGASATGNVGIIQACQLLENGLIDRCVVIGALADLSPLELHAWSGMGAAGGNTFSPEESCRPFDHRHDGFIYGQGCGCLILERDDSFQKSESESFASIRGYSLNLDANRSSNPSVAGESRAMRQALNAANMLASDIQYINTHGSSSVLGDETEVLAIKEVFSEPNGVWLNATKGLTGHCLYSAGVIEAIATIVQMQHGFLHPNKNLENPIDTSLQFVGSIKKDLDVYCSLSNSFGFGGINSSIVFTKSDL